jgi:hypothetical protein
MSTYSVDKSQFVEVDPGGHELVAQGNQGALVAEHKFLRCHVDEGLSLSLFDQHVHRHPREDGRSRHQIGETLQQNKIII